jgi:hypothetical protein
MRTDESDDTKQTDATTETAERDERDRPPLAVVRASPPGRPDAGGALARRWAAPLAPAAGEGELGVLPRGVWLGTYFVRPGVRELVAVDSRGVLRVRAEFTTQAEAIRETERLWRALDTLDPTRTPAGFTGRHRDAT